LSREPDLEFPREVPGSEGRLWAIDIRDYGWNNAAWWVVARRETYFREPLFHDPVSVGKSLAYLRTAIGSSQDINTFAAEVIVRADWLIRETAETDRSTAYYDLLFSRERFGDREYHGGKWYFRGQGKGGFVDANFPRDEADWDRAFGGDVLRKLIGDQRLRVERGAVVDRGVSIVARENRLLEGFPLPTGRSWKTFDVNVTAGKRDFAEQRRYDFKFDAGELIVSLPNGGQAYLLVNGQKKRVETADPKIAIDSTDPSDRRVRTPGSCVICHGVGINSPVNLMEQFVKDGLDTLFRDKQRLREDRAFFLGVQKVVKEDQDRYNDFVKRTTGQTGEQNAAAFKASRDAYDRDIDLKQAAAETGLTEEKLRYVALASPNARFLSLVRGRTIPRQVWQDSVYREVFLLLNARK
jgi:hypothetical protein